MRNAIYSLFILTACVPSPDGDETGGASSEGLPTLSPSTSASTSMPSTETLDTGITADTTAVTSTDTTVASETTAFDECESVAEQTMLYGSCETLCFGECVSPGDDAGADDTAGTGIPERKCVPNTLDGFEYAVCTTTCIVDDECEPPPFSAPFDVAFCAHPSFTCQIACSMGGECPAGFECVDSTMCMRPVTA